MYKNYIFDLYGTLVDIHTNEGSAYLWKKMQELYGFYGAEYSAKDLKKEYGRLCEEKSIALKKQGFEDPEINVEDVFMELFTNKGVTISKEEVAVVIRMFRIISTKYIRLYEPVIEFLELLKKKGKNIYLLSNAQAIFTKNEMDYLGITKYFDGIVFSSDEKCKKPSKQFYDVVLNRYKLKKEESIMIGNDWKADILGAKNAGLDRAYLHTNISPWDTVIENVQADIIIKDGDLGKLKKIVK